MNRELQKEIKNSFPKIRKLFVREYIWEFSQTPFAELKRYNYGMGTMIKLKVLKRNKRFYKLFVQNGVTDWDEMTMIIIYEFHQSLAEIVRKFMR